MVGGRMDGVGSTMKTRWWMDSQTKKKSAYNVRRRYRETGTMSPLSLLWLRDKVSRSSNALLSRVAHHVRYVRRYISTYFTDKWHTHAPGFLAASEFLNFFFARWTFCGNSHAYIGTSLRNIQRVYLYILNETTTVV